MFFKNKYHQKGNAVQGVIRSVFFLINLFKIPIVFSTFIVIFVVIKIANNLSFISFNLFIIIRFLKSLNLILLINFLLS